jgi:hypothetical protein
MPSGSRRRLLKFTQARHEVLAQGVGTASAVRQRDIIASLRRAEHVAGGAAVVRLAPGELECDRQAAGVAAPCATYRVRYPPLAHRPKTA